MGTIVTTEHNSIQSNFSFRVLPVIEMAPWPGSNETAKIPPLTPELCYRFVLSNPHVHLVLTGPKNREQLMANLKAIQQGALTPDELNWIRQYGKQIRSKKRFDYIK